MNTNQAKKEAAAHRPMMPTPEAAEYLGISESTLNKTRVFGTGPAYIKLGRRVLYRPEDLDRYLAENVRRSTSDPGMTQAHA